jgi:hypothetical protein
VDQEVPGSRPGGGTTLPPPEKLEHISVRRDVFVRRASALRCIGCARYSIVTL